MAGNGPQPDLVPLFELAAAAGSLGLLGLAGRAVPSRLARDLAGLLVIPALLAAAAVTASLGWPRPFWLPPLVLAGVCGLFLAARSPLLRRARWRLLTRAAAPSVQWGGLLLAGLALFVWGACQAGSDPAPSGEADLPDQAERGRAMASLRAVAAPVARTDRGRRVRLLAIPEAVLTPAMVRAMEAKMAQEWGPSLRLLRTGPPDGRSDCHGWVFTAGRFWILGVDVELILQDNGYRRVMEPREGDLVVYRGDRGRITHSGVVFAAHGGGPVLVESKWAWLGTYLHAHDAQPYGGYPAYYRSDRAGHGLLLEFFPP